MAEDPNGSEMDEKVVALKVQASRRLSSPGVKAEGGDSEAKIKLASLPAHVSKMLAFMDSDAVVLDDDDDVIRSASDGDDDSESGS